MTSRFKIIILLSSLLVLLFVSISTVNYFTSISNAQKQLKTQSLPLTLDNIYTEIQKYIIHPYLISSMMANDTFVQDWLSTKESDKQKIVKYLNNVNSKYNMFSTFLVSNKTKNYYTQNGFIEKVNINKSKWYFNFKDSKVQHEINLDFNKNISNSLIMFINYKILNNKKEFIGATGVALKVEYINAMLKKFRNKYGFIVTFFDKDGKVVLSEKATISYLSVNNHVLNKFKNKILSKDSNIIEFSNNNSDYIVNTKYIPELNLYVTVEAKLDNYIKDVKKVLYINLLISFIFTLIMAYVFFSIITKYNNKLEFMAFNDSLTGLFNRRYFETKLEYIIKLFKRTNQDYCILFLDIDDFKKINDNFGHDIGDIILKEIANVLNENIRETDFIARWGGEELVIVLSNTKIDDAKIISEKLRILLENNSKLKELVSYNITASFGLTQFIQDDTIDSIVSRVDKAMYISKTTGKNKISVL